MKLKDLLGDKYKEGMTIEEIEAALEFEFGALILTQISYKRGFR